VSAVARERFEAAPTDEGVNLRDLLQIVRESLSLFVLIVVVFTGLATAASLYLPNWYDSQIVLAAVTDQSTRSGLGSALGSAISQLGGAAGLAGLMQNPEARAEAVATLQSAALTQRYITDNNLIPVLFAKKWDAANKKWKSDDPKKQPTLWTANHYFERKIRTVEQSGKTGLITMTISWKDEKVAAQWANDLVALTNQYLRDKAIRQSERNIAYLNEQLPKTSAVELRNAIYELIEGEIKKEMIARGSDEYALKVIDPAFPSENASSPSPGIWIPVGFGVGLAFAFVVAMVRHTLRRERVRGASG
jgi:uncharacterized protein involved in exopolysaccharide biosynthesis